MPIHEQFLTKRTTPKSAPKPAKKPVAPWMIAVGVAIALTCGSMIIGAFRVIQNVNKHVREHPPSAQAPLPRHRNTQQPGRQGGADGSFESVSETARLDQLFPESNPAFSPAQLNAWLPELQRLVESAAGRPFKHLPPVKIVTRRELRQKLGVDSGADSRLIDDVPGESEIQTIIMLGLYDPADATVYMLAGNFQPMLQMDGVSSEMYEPIAKLVLAHELAHALQDQQLDLKRLDLAVKNIEERQALRATMEGHATMVEDLVATKLGLVEADPELVQKVAGGAITPDQAQIQSLIQRRNIIGELYYTKGRDFFMHNFDRGGSRQVWQILANPPKDTAVFINPAIYWQPGKALASADALFADMAADFGYGAGGGGARGGWNEQKFNLGSFTLRMMYYELGSKNVDTMMTLIQSVRCMVLNKGDSAFASIMVFHLRPAADPAAFVRELERAPPILLADHMGAARDSVHCQAAYGVKGSDGGGYRDMVLDVQGSDSSPPRGRVMRMTRGKVVVEITTLGAESADPKRIDIANQIFQRCEQATAESVKP